MNKVFFSADFHLGHLNIIKYCNRPFKTAEEMNETIISNINEVVGVNDTLFIIGDFGMGTHQQLNDFRMSILCSNILLVPGNHDKQPIASLPRTRPIHTMTICEKHLVLCHYAMRTWPSSHHGTWHLYGHSHNSLYEDPMSLSFDCGVDGNNLKPYSMEDIIERMSAKEQHIKSVYQADNVYYFQ